MTNEPNSRRRAAIGLAFLGVVFAIFLAISLRSGCGRPSGDNGEGGNGDGVSNCKIDFSPPGFFGDHKPDRVTVVFVHGIGGDGLESWLNPSCAYWPNMLRSDPLFKDANIFVHQYPTGIGPRDGFNINELAENMRSTFDHNDLSRDRLVFLCHSMGGLVARQFLLKYPNYARRTALLYCLGTPTEGSQVARIGRFYKNPQLDDMMIDRNGHNYLANIVRDWQAAGYSITIPSYVGYETKGYPGIGRVVDFYSGTALANHPLDPIAANHTGLAKPASVNDGPYVAFYNAFKKEIITDNLSTLKNVRHRSNEECRDNLLASGKSPDALGKPRSPANDITVTITNSSSFRARLSVLDVAAMIRASATHQENELAIVELPWRSVLFDPLDASDPQTKPVKLDFANPSQWLAYYLAVIGADGKVTQEYFDRMEKIPSSGAVKIKLILSETGTPDRPVTVIVDSTD